MKWWIGILVLVCVGGAGGLYWRAQGPDASVGSATTSPNGIVGVEALMRGVDSHRGSVRVEGVVATIAADRQLFMLIDRKEFAECNDLNCAQLMLPVQWTGPLPATKDIVEVAGEIKEMTSSATGKQARLVFVASAVRKVQ